jgi:LuxR family maltose regulon positive regulatory protein
MVELLRTKLFIPRPRKNLVSRPRLIECLNAGLDKKLTLIAAPAGFGKTTLLSEWIPQSPRCVTWLSLDEDDNDPVKFWAYFIKSVQGLQDELGAGAFSLLQSPQTLPINSILTTLINDIIAFPDAFSIVLDDYHIIDSKAIHEGLTFLIEHQPVNMHLIITTRMDPPLPLARLRAKDQLTELRANALRFTAGETTAFLNRVMGLNLSSEEVAAMEARTEGWIAGLQIAALSMQGHDDVSGFIRAFSGSHRYILGYLAEEVINRQPEGTQNFLLQTSILERLCGELCDAVTEQPSGQAMLEGLERANLFVVPLDDERKWYRYHHLFAEVLQGRMRQAHCELIPELHRRACNWFEQNNLTDEAVSHAIAGDVPSQAAGLVEQLISIKWQTGEIKTLQKWLAAIPRSAWHTYPRLWLVQAWVAMTVGDFVEGDLNLKAAEEALGSLDPKTTQHLRAEVRAFRASYASLTQDPQAIELAEQALNELAEDYWMRGMLVIFLAAAYYSVGNLDTALDILAEAPGSSLTDRGMQPHRIHLLAFTGTVHYAKGRLNDSLPFFYDALGLAEPGGVPIPFVGTLLAYMSITPVLYEQNKLEQASSILNRCLKMSIEFGSTEVEIYTLSLLAQACLAQEDLSAAMKYFDRINTLLLKHTFSFGIMSFIEYRRFVLYLKQGDLSAAEKWVDANGQGSGLINPHAFHRIAHPQLLIAQHKYDLALEKLTNLIREAEETDHGNWLVKALVLKALVFDGLGQHITALDTMKRVLALAEPEGYMRSFLDEGEPMRVLLLNCQSMIKTKLSDGVDSETIHLLTYIDGLLATFSQPALIEKSKAASLPEPLSDRELDILRLIAAGRSNQEIAEILVIAVSTVKSHINNLYGKLGTNRRTEAIAIARDMGLLSD